MRFTRLLNLSVLLFAAFLAGCASSGNIDDETHGLTVAELYNKAKKLLNDREYESAIQHYETLESRFPYGVYAERARIEVAYATIKTHSLKQPLLRQTVLSSYILTIKMLIMPIIYVV